MTWVKVSDDWFEEPHVEDIGAGAAMLHLSALAYSARHGTDGVVPTRALRRLYPVDDADQVIATLIDAGMWTSISSGYQLVDWAAHILSADEVTQIREQNRVRQERLRRHNKGDHSMCSSCWYVRNSSHHAVSNGVTAGVSNGPPTRPDSTRLDPTEGGESREADRAASAGAPAARPPQRTSGGLLAAIDDQNLAALPWDDIPGRCLHRDDGLTWDDGQHFACSACDRSIRGNGHPDYAISGLLHPMTGIAPGVLVWQELFDVDPETTTLVLDVASLIAHQVGDPDTTALDVERAAEDIYRRVDVDKLADAYAAVESRQEQNA